MQKFRYIIFSGCLLLSSMILGQAPTITGVDFADNAPGANVILAGSGFSTDASKMIVTFGGVLGTITSSTSINLEVTPPPNAKFDNVVVLNTETGLSATSAFKYFTTFGGDTFDPALFTLSETFNTLVPQHDIVASDFNNDGLIDIVTTKINAGPNDITVHQNQSTGIGSIAFSQWDKDDMASLNIGEPTRNIICGDVNNDGWQDLIISGNLSGNRNKVHVLLNNTNTAGADISFQSKVTLLIPDGTTAIRMAVTDLDGDGKHDIAVVDRENNKFFVFKNTSSGGVSFDTAKEIVVSGAVKFWGLEVQDMDGDGKADIILNQFQDDNVYIVKNTSTPSTLSFDQVTIIELAINIRNLKAGYVNKDDKLDIVVTHESTDQISIIKNNSTVDGMQFEVIDQWETTPGAAPWGVDMADADGDGDLDIFIANKNNNPIDVLVNNSTESSVILQKESITTFLGTRNLALADFDGDAKTDMALTSSVVDGAFYTMQIWRNEHCFVPTILGESDLTICDQSLTLEGTRTTSGVTYNWFKNGNGTAEKSAMENFIVIQPSDVLATTTYTLQSRDADGCVKWAAETVTISPNGGAIPPSPTIIPVSAVCEGEDVTLQVQSPDDINFIYTWAGPDGFSATGSSVDVVNFTAENVGEYILIASSGPCLSGESSIIVNKKGLPVIDVLASGVTTFCAGSSVTLSASNTGIISGYKWFDTSGELSTNSTLDVTQSGEYYAEVIADGCNVTTSSVVVVAYSVPVASFTASKTTGCTDEEITFTNTSSVDNSATVSYLWGFGDTSTSDEESPTHTFSSGNTYTVSLDVSYVGVTCPNGTSEAITINDPLDLTIAAAKSAICPEEELELSIGVDFTDINWTSGETTSLITITGDGTHDVSAIDINGCNVSSSVVIDAKEIPVITIVPADTTITNGSTIQLEASGADIYSWSPMDGLNDPTIFNPLASPSISTLYVVEGMVTDGCTGSAEVNIFVTEASDGPPKVLAVNSTSALANWQIADATATACALTIFNRNGTKVFEGSGNVVEWDGTNSGKDLPQGTYFYVFTCDDGQPKTGSILLMKL